jgi:pimeloyl-ACP methyl ester carboxylesterase
VAFLEAGPLSGPIVLCLHGFPDTPWTWRHLAPRLVANGCHVVAPYLRGYAPTEVCISTPPGPQALGRDANALHQALDGDARAILIGHDWGAAAAYSAASSGRWKAIAAASWPPFPGDIDVASYEQMRRSWYVFLFHPPAADALIRANNFALIDRLWADWSPGYDSVDDRARAKEALSAPGCLEYTLNCYRSLFGAEQPMISMNTPLLYLHGKRDGCIGVEFAAQMQDGLPPGSRVEILDAAGHFPYLETPEAFASSLLSFISQMR